MSSSNRNTDDEPTLHRAEKEEFIDEANGSDLDTTSQTLSKRLKRDKKEDRSLKKRKHKRKHHHTDLKHKDNKLKFKGGIEGRDSLSDETFQILPSESKNVERESWMTMGDLKLDASTVDDSFKRAKVSRTTHLEGIRTSLKDYNLSSGSTHNSDLVAQDGATAAHLSTDSLKLAPPNSVDALNVLQARLIKAQLMGGSDLATLEDEYHMALAQHKAAQKADDKRVPFFDARGKYVDIRSSKPSKESSKNMGSTLSEEIRDLVQQEKRSTSLDLYGQLARKISKDFHYEDDDEYQDERAAHLAAHRPRSEYQKRMIATNDYRRTKRALDSCIFCSGVESTPAAPIVSMGHHVYLSLPSYSELVPGHCLIVPGEHLLTTLDADDAMWLEIRNFMKCLMQMFAEHDKGVVFMETVLNLANCYHTVIECIPLPWGDAEDAPGYFKEGLLGVDEEWSRHAKVIETKERTFRRSMSSQLPYFHVWFHPDGGYGHVIEDHAKFPRYFGQEIIAGILNLDPMQWRRPTKYPLSEGISRAQEFKANHGWEKFDWTKMLD